MPWTPEEFKKFKKEMTDDEATKGCAIANTLLEKCLVDGGKQDDCESMAIATALKEMIASPAEDVPLQKKDVAIQPDQIRIDSKKKVNAVRTDAGKVKIFRDENGVLTAEVVIARPGVFPYRDSDGSVHHEFKDPKDILADGFLKQTIGLPVTDNHPDEGLVTQDNSSLLAKGVTHSSPYKQDGLVYNVLSITDRTLADLVRKGFKKEVSIGFLADIIDEAGEYEGQKYDRVQRNIRLNHVAIVPRGRCGAVCAIQTDATDATQNITISGSSGNSYTFVPEMGHIGSTVDSTFIKIEGNTCNDECQCKKDVPIIKTTTTKQSDSGAGAPTRVSDESAPVSPAAERANEMSVKENQMETKESNVVKLQFGSKVLTFDASQSPEAFAKQIAALQPEVDQMINENTDLANRTRQAEGKREDDAKRVIELEAELNAKKDYLDLVQAKVSTLESEINDLTNGKSLDHRVDDRLALVREAESRVPGYTYVGKVNDDIKRDILKAINAHLKTDEMDTLQLDSYLKAWRETDKYMRGQQNQILKLINGDSAQNDKLEAARLATLKKTNKK